MNSIKDVDENDPLITSESSTKKHERVVGTKDRKEMTSVNETSIIIAKTCVGMGTLALPCAASQGGYLFSAIGLAFIALWNLYAVDRLVKCADIIPHSVESCTTENNEDEIIEELVDEMQTISELNVNENKYKMKRPNRASRSKSIAKKQAYQTTLENRIDLESVEPSCELGLSLPPSGTSTFGKVAWHAFGSWGLHFLDFIMISLFMGVIISYEDLLIGFIGKTPFSAGSPKLDSLWVLFFLASISLIPDISFLAPYSASGLATIIFTYLVISVYGLTKMGDNWDSDSLQWESLWPANFTGVASWFGMVVFSFGIVPIAYNIQEAMTEPKKMVQSTEQGLKLVCLIYVIVSTGVAIVFSPEPHSFKSDVLQQLPDNWIAIMTYIALTFVAIVTAPLLLMPCADIFRGKFGILSGNIYLSNILIRCMICSVCTMVAVLVPDFVKFISFFGSACVAFVSFTLPPLMYIALMSKGTEESGLSSSFSVNSSNHLLFDKAMLIVGILVTCVASFLTFEDMFGS